MRPLTIRSPAGWYQYRHPSWSPADAHAVLRAWTLILDVAVADWHTDGSLRKGSAGVYGAKATPQGFAANNFAYGLHQLHGRIIQVCIEAAIIMSLSDHHCLPRLSFLSLRAHLYKSLSMSSFKAFDVMS